MRNQGILLHRKQSPDHQQQSTWTLIRPTAGVGHFSAPTESILSLAKFCDNLETLIIGGCWDISDESMKSLAAACNHNLEKLRMDWWLIVSDSSLNCILSKFLILEVLDIGFCEEATDAAFLGLVSEGNNKLALKILKLSNCPKITVGGIGMLLDSFKCLEYLDVRSCPHITKVDCDVAVSRIV